MISDSLSQQKPQHTTHIIDTMKAKSIGTRTLATNNPKRKPLTQGPKPATGPADIYPVTVRINVGPSKGRVHTFARIIITDNALYLATSPDKGNTIETVTQYALPTGDRKTSGAKKGSWGAFSWSGCGCVNSWGKHPRTHVITQATKAA